MRILILTALIATGCGPRFTNSDFPAVQIDNVQGIVVDPINRAGKVNLCYVPPAAMPQEPGRAPSEPRIMPFHTDITTQNNFKPGDLITFTLAADWTNADTPVRITNIRTAHASEKSTFSCDSTKPAQP